MKKIFILFFTIFLMSCGHISKIKSEIKLKNDYKEPTFESFEYTVGDKLVSEKLVPGEYNINLYSIKYPTEILENNKFYEDYYNFLVKVVLDKKRFSMLIPQKMYDDLEKMKEETFLEVDNVYYKAASSLNADELEELISLTKKGDFSDYTGTNQEYLNRQVYLLYMLLNKDDFVSGTVYTELDKEFLMDEIRQKRNKIIESIAKSDIDTIVKIEENFEDIIEEDNKSYQFDKDIEINSGLEEKILFSSIKYPVLVDITDKELTKKLVDGEIKLKNKFILFDNDEFIGYSYNDGNYIYFLNGSKEVNYFPEYNINIEVLDFNFSKILSDDNKYEIRDFFK